MQQQTNLKEAVKKYLVFGKWSMARSEAYKHSEEYKSRIKKHSIDNRFKMINRAQRILDECPTFIDFS
jgi:hypothetical protein